MQRFVSTSDALPVVDGHLRDNGAAGEVDTEVVAPAYYRSDALGDGYRPPDLVFSHLPGPKAWYNICNAPRRRAELAIVARKHGEGAVQQEGEDPRNTAAVGGQGGVLLAKLRGLLGIVKKGQTSMIGKVSGGEECGCADEDDDDDGCSESWKRRDARRYGLVGSFELESGRWR